MNSQSCRNFDTLEEHDNIIIEGINNFVLADDILWHLGDFCMGGSDNLWKYRKQIICKNINLIVGNHDHHIANNRILNNCRRKKAFSKEFEDGIPEGVNYFVNTQELFSTVNQLSIKTFGGIDFSMCHYAMRTWNNNYRENSIMLYGHSHGSLPDYEYLKQDLENNNKLLKTNYYYKTMDVGIDSAFNLLGQYRPFSLEEILEVMKLRIPFGKEND